MKFTGCSKLIIGVGPVVLSRLLVAFGNLVQAQTLYFRGDDSNWKQVDPANLGWDADTLSKALYIAGERNSSGLLILHNKNRNGELHD